MSRQMRTVTNKGEKYFPFQSRQGMLSCSLQVLLSESKVILFQLNGFISHRLKREIICINYPILLRPHKKWMLKTSAGWGYATVCPATHTLSNSTPKDFRSIPRSCFQITGVWNDFTVLELAMDKVSVVPFQQEHGFVIGFCKQWAAPMYMWNILQIKGGVDRKYKIYHYVKKYLKHSRKTVLANLLIENENLDFYLIITVAGFF